MSHTNCILFCSLTLLIFFSAYLHCTLRLVPATWFALHLLHSSSLCQRSMENLGFSQVGFFLHLSFHCTLNIISSKNCELSSSLSSSRFDSHKTSYELSKSIEIYLLKHHCFDFPVSPLPLPRGWEILSFHDQIHTFDICVNFQLLKK